MEITKKGKFITGYMGSTPAVGSTGILKKWVEDKQDASLLSWADQIKKKGETAEQALENILSVFHRDKNGNPILGNWMLRRCLIVTGQTIFNALKDKSHPKKSVIPMAIQLVEPLHMPLQNGKLITTPDKVKTFTISLKNRSFFKAYEYIKEGAEFEAKVYFDEELLSEEHMNMILDKCGSVGVGAFRERYGKFEWV